MSETDNLSGLTLAQQVHAVTEDVPHLIANLANTSSLIFGYFDRINWAGFYLMEDGKLVLGPFQGKPACIEIAVGRGVCGTVAMRDETVIVEDVHCFEGHIACDSDSESEIVIPIHKNGKLFGVLDIDSPVKHRFTDVEKKELEETVRVLETAI